MEDKKIEEIAILEVFREELSDFPGGVISPSESPDFILSLGPKKKIGIELTRLSQQLPGSDPFSYENISACLLAKELKLRLYKKRRLFEYWLILVVRDPAYTPGQNLNNKLIKWVFSSGFNRVFLFYLARNKIYELYTG